MRPFFLYFLSISLLGTSGINAQSVYSVTETLMLPKDATATGAMIYARLPLTAGGQVLSQEMYSLNPLTIGPEGISWTGESLAAADSLRLNYRVRVAPISTWFSDSLLALPAPTFSWPPPAPGEPDAPYVLPPLVREDIGKTELRNLDPGENSLDDVDRVIRRLGRRVKLARNSEDFDYGQPLLQDLYRRLSTPRRKHLLLSLTLQYLGVPHRVVSGKILSYGEVLENELWVEIPVSGRYYRVYYGDGIDRSEWGPPEDPDRFLACSFDWRDFTLEVVSAVGAPPVPTTLVGRYQNVVLEFWEKKDEALGRKRYGQAVAFLDSVLTYMPNSVITVSEIGLVYAEAGRPEDGMKYLEAAQKLAVTLQDRSTAQLQLARYYSMLQQPEESLQALARAYRYAPIDLSVIYTDPRLSNLAKLRGLEQRLNAYLRDEG